MTKVERVRISLGTAIKLGLEHGPKLKNFTTCFFMTYHKSGCIANCAFCPQSRETHSDSMLSRIEWPVYPFNEVIERLDDHSFERFCIQCLNYRGVIDDAEHIAGRLAEITNSPISVCIQPISVDDMIRLKNAGVQNIGIALDAATPLLFDQIKGKHRHGPYRWEHHIKALQQARDVFGKDNVTTHLIVGLGESEQDAAEFLVRMYSGGIRVGLFAFTNIENTALETQSPPDLHVYRRIQTLRYLLHNKLISPNQVQFSNDGRITFAVDRDWLRETLSSGFAFQVSGCLGCNRPYYNERPSGPMYNYPHPLSAEEIEKAIDETELMK